MLENTPLPCRSQVLQLWKTASANANRRTFQHAQSSVRGRQQQINASMKSRFPELHNQWTPNFIAEEREVDLKEHPEQWALFTAMLDLRTLGQSVSTLLGQDLPQDVNMFFADLREGGPFQPSAAEELFRQTAQEVVALGASMLQTYNRGGGAVVLAVDDDRKVLVSKIVKDHPGLHTHFDYYFGYFDLEASDARLNPYQSVSVVMLSPFILP